MSRLSEWFSGLRDIRTLADEPGQGRFLDDDPGEELDDEYEPPRRIESGWDQEPHGVSAGNPLCPHVGCMGLITFIQGADGREKASCEVHGVVKPVWDRARPDDGRYWGDGNSMVRPQALWEPTRRSAALRREHLRVAVRSRKPLPKPKYEAPLDPLDYGIG
jgi:hypothetical protein